MRALLTVIYSTQAVFMLVHNIICSVTDTNLRHLSKTQCAILESFSCFVDGSELRRKIFQTKGTFDILGLKRVEKYCFLK